jgi:ADP-ribosyl-[dinitrogen reductase] hydrolase
MAESIGRGFLPCMRNDDRARGVLWGQAIGDALGTTNEFERDPKPLSDIVGGGPFWVKPGQVTDDTHMAVCLAESLAECGRYDAEDAARRYVAWSKKAFDIGNQTRATLHQVEKGVKALLAGHVVWEYTNRDASANGSLMRCSPLPVFFAEDAAALRRAALDDASITHADPRCRLACAAFTAAIRHALADPGATAASMHAVAREELALAACELRDTPRETEKALALLREDLELATQDDPALGREVYTHAGYVRVAFRLAFFTLLHAESFERALLDVVNRGGDADTNGAIAGALLGAWFGEAAIRADWRAKVEGACRGDPIWGDTYHPRRLFAVVR